MLNTDNPAAKTLADLGVTHAPSVAPLFDAIRSRFDAESAAIHNEPAWKIFRDTWLGRKSGILAHITENWLKPATPDLKRAVGAGLNELRAHVESQIESRRQAIESGADQSALAHEHIDLSLPGARII
jgi:phenylalanyl-tRNA synthetase alpha subunit